MDSDATTVDREIMSVIQLVILEVNVLLLRGECANFLTEMNSFSLTGPEKYIFLFF